jgi:hypothetical protein
MRFFVPGISNPQAEAAYRALYEAAKDQLRTPITAKRILSLNYVHDKQAVCVRVGEAHPEQYRYRVVAILESRPFIVMTQSLTGSPGPTYMVNSAEITEVTEFED